MPQYVPSNIPHGPGIKSPTTRGRLGKLASRLAGRNPGRLELMSDHMLMDMGLDPLDVRKTQRSHSRLSF